MCRGQLGEQAQAPAASTPAKAFSGSSYTSSTFSLLGHSTALTLMRSRWSSHVGVRAGSSWST